MKPISEWNISEIVHALRQDDDWYVEIANRIHEIAEYERDGIIAISDAYQMLKESYRWIPFEERHPIGLDGKEILVYDSYRGVYAIEQGQIREYNPTHWRRIDTP